MTVNLDLLDHYNNETIAQVEEIKTLTIGNDEERKLNALKKQLNKARKANRNKYQYYETRQRVEQLDIAVPPHLRDVFTVCGWPEIIVDVLEERIDLLGITSESGNLDGLDETFDDCDMSLEFSRGTIDALVAGTNFFTAGTGDPDKGEPEIIVKAESPNNATAIWDYRMNGAMCGISQTYDEVNRLVMQSFYLPNKTVLFAADPFKGNKLEIVDIDEHNMGRVLMARQVTRDRASNPHGRSEITRPVRYYTDHAIRTMLGMEVNREFYTTPMRAALDVDPKTLGFKDDMSPAQKEALGWRIMMGHINIIPPQGDGSPINQPRPSIQQFAAQPPTPYIEEIKACSIMLSGETGMPATMFGFVTDNPTSGDAILKGEYRLVRRAERRIQSYDRTVKDIILLMKMLKERNPNLTRADVRQYKPLWRNPAVPTRAAQADETQKLVAAKVLPPRGEVTYTRLDINSADQRKLERDWRAEDAREQAQLAREQARTLSTQVAVAKVRQPAPAPGGGQPGRPNVGGGPTS